MTEQHRLLYGHSVEPGIVSIELVPGRENMVQVFVQTETGIDSYYDTYKPHIYVRSEENCVRDARDVESIPLLGTNYFDTRIECINAKTIFWIRKNAQESFMPMLKSQYQYATGKTLFKGMNFDDVVRLYIDIETITAPGFDFPNPDRPEDRIVIISMRCNDGREWVIQGDDESALLNEFIKTFRAVDPTVVVGHNIFNFDLPYIQTRCHYHGIDLALGRNGSVPETNTSNIKLAEKNKEYTNWSIYGRTVMDTMFMAMQWDIVKRKLPSYGLKDIAKTLGFAAENRTYVEGSDISRMWSEERERLIEYALDDVRETQKLDQFFGASYFYLTQMLPMSYQDTWRYGTGTKIDSLFIREYYQQNWSLPKASPKMAYGGGYAAAHVTGRVDGDMIYVDVASLYPTIMDTAEIQPAKDELCIFRTMLVGLKEMRLKQKALAQRYAAEGKKELAAAEDARQNISKIIINSFYGWLGWEYGMFNDYEEAERITNTGQEIIKKIIEIASLYDAIAIKSDTDGTILKLPEKYKGSYDNEMILIKKIEVDLNEWYRRGHIDLGHDGRFKAGIIVDKKSYVLLGHDDKLTIKGNTLRSRSMEPYGRRFLDAAVREVISGDLARIPELYADVRDDILLGGVNPIDLAYKKELNQSLEEYRNKRRAGGNPIAQYEVAVNSSRPYRKGDRVTYYIKTPELVDKLVRNKIVRRYEATNTSALAREFADYDGDYFVEHYLDRLDKVTKRLLVILKEDIFRELFPEIKITKADLRKIKEEDHESDDNEE